VANVNNDAFAQCDIVCLAMAGDDWFRHTKWTPQVQEAFFKRLSRSRSPAGKAQYLRIQASHLQHTKEKSLACVALRLLDEMLEKYPEPVQMAQGRLQQAQCLAFLGDCEGAIDKFRMALVAERACPNVKTQTWLEFGWFVLERGRADLHDEILHVMTEFRRTIVFPVETFRFHGIQALILANRGRVRDAKEHARLAMEAAAKNTSDLRHHPTLGLVADLESPIAREIALLATDARA
jgi:hypothetical protein